MIRGAIAALLLSPGVAACVQAPVVHQQGAATSCINLNQIAGRRVADGGGVEFEMSNGTVMLNRLQGHCPGLVRLGKSATISVANGGEDGMLCRGDRIRVADPIESSATGIQAQPTCILGDFSAAPR